MEKVNVKAALLAFNRIVDEGTKDGDEYVLNGLYASTGFDGYTVTIRTAYARLEIYFHNNISFWYDSNREKDMFLSSLYQLSMEKKSA